MNSVGFRSLTLSATAGLCLLMFAGAPRAEAQDCQSMLNQLLNGQPGYGSPQWGQGIADQYNSNCLGGQSQQPSSQPPAENLFDNAVTRELSALDTMLIRGQPQRQDIPLSSGTVMMQNAPAPPPAPTNYVDPFAARTFPPITESAAGPVKKYGSIWDPSQWVRLSPPAQTPPAAQTPGTQSGPCGPYAAQTGDCRAPVTGFQQGR
jgi:hypothetical protein